MEIDEAKLDPELLSENAEVLANFDNDGKPFKKQQEVVFRAQFDTKAIATQAKEVLRELHVFDVTDLVFTEPLPDEPDLCDCVIAVEIPVTSLHITYFEQLLIKAGDPLGGSRYAWEIQP